MRILKYILLCVLTTCGNVQAVEQLGKQYLISYGKEDASIKLVEYFSFQCPHCLKIFKNDFARIKKEYIDTGKILFEFHPTPLDLPTLQAMVCLAQLDAHQKQLFLEVMFEEAIPNEPELMAQCMIAAMGIFKKPLPLLDDHEFLKRQSAFNDAFVFLQQEEKVLAVPTAEINGKLFPKDVPDFKFVQNAAKKGL